MINIRKKIISTFLLFSIFSLFGYKIVLAVDVPDYCQQTPIPTDKINECIPILTNKGNELKTQANTLSSQIAVFDNQIRLTEYRIEATKQQISDLVLDIDTTTKKISGLEKTLDVLAGVLANRIVATYEVGRIQPLHILLTSNNISNFFSRLNYLKIAQQHDKTLIYNTQQAKNDYANQKDIFEGKKKKIELLKRQLENYTAELNQEKANKKDLLAQTQGSESVYQNLLAQAKAQLAALSSFATSRTGGIEIISHSELSDSWGKYYNQRDANWGNNIVGVSSERIWAVGCLLTSYAMVYTHYGGSISPADVAANSGNFWFSTALFLKPGPSANGRSAEAVYNPSFDYLRDQLNNGNAVIAGLSYDGGPIADHWLVLRSVDGDSFKVNDPLYEGAMNVSFNDHYKGLKIVEVRIYR